MMGPTIANSTLDLYFKNGCFHVKLKSAALREELSYGKQKIVSGLNEMLGKDIVKEVRLV